MEAPSQVIPVELRNVSCPAFSGTQIRAYERIRGGNNNRIYRVGTGDGRLLAVKFYYTHPSDSRDRLGTEFGAISFMWANGLRCIPEPVGVDQTARAAVYGFIEGEKWEPSSIADDDISAAAGFVQALHALAMLPAARQMAPASEAYFCLAEVLQNIDKRFQKLLTSRGGSNPAQSELEEFIPKLEGFLGDVRAWITGSAMGAEELNVPLDEASRTISPSDFGFHNALVKADGARLFLDFEYFGRDDPVKLISDFLLHPGMKLAYPLQARFVREILPIFGPSERLLSRLEHAYALYAVKWCLIILNEFVPEFLARRGFAGTQAESLQQVQLGQLTKAETLIDTVRGHYQNFRRHFGATL